MSRSVCVSQVSFSPSRWRVHQSSISLALFSLRSASALVGFCCLRSTIAQRFMARRFEPIVRHDCSMCSDALSQSRRQQSISASAWQAAPAQAWFQVAL